MDNRYVQNEDAFMLILTIFSSRMLKDERVRGEQERSIFQFRDVSDRMG